MVWDRCFELDISNRVFWNRCCWIVVEMNDSRSSRIRRFQYSSLSVRFFSSALTMNGGRGLITLNFTNSCTVTTKATGGPHSSLPTTRPKRLHGQCSAARNRASIRTKPDILGRNPRLNPRHEKEGGWLYLRWSVYIGESYRLCSIFRFTFAIIYNGKCEPIKGGTHA